MKGHLLAEHSDDIILSVDQSGQRIKACVIRQLRATHRHLSQHRRKDPSFPFHIRKRITHLLPSPYHHGYSGHRT
jgi:hypothetical protein